MRVRICGRGCTGASVCFRACSLIQRVKRHHIVIYGLCGCTTFLDIISNGRIFGKKLPNTQCISWFSLQLLLETFLILRINQRDTFINVKTSSCKVPVILVGFYCNLNFLNRFSKIAQISSFIKIHPIKGPSCPMRTYGQTDMTKLILAFRNFANVPKNYEHKHSGNMRSIQ